MVLEREGGINSRGQVTIFIIIAIVIVGLAVLIYFLFPSIRSNITGETQSPSQYIDTCMREKIEETIEVISLQGGSTNPQSYYLYEDNKIAYLCYTNEYYKLCTVQEPFVKEKIEREIVLGIEESANSCFESMIANYRNEGYDVSISYGDRYAELLPERVVVTFNNNLTLTKGETSEFKNFNVILTSRLYELTSIATSIIQKEATYGDVDQTIYMDLYSYIKAEKKKQTDGTTIYIITDRDSGNKFEFASRSLAFPPGV